MGGEGGGESRGRRANISDEICTTLVDHVLNSVMLSCLTQTRSVHIIIIHNILCPEEIQASNETERLCASAHSRLL